MGAFSITNAQLVPLATAYSLSRLMAGHSVSPALLETAVEGIPMVTRDAFLLEVQKSAPYPENAGSRVGAFWRPEDVASAFSRRLVRTPIPGEGISNAKESDLHPFDMVFPTSDPNPSIDAALKEISGEIKSLGFVTPASLCDLGNAYLRNGDYDEALVAFRRALRLDPHPRTYTEIAILYRRVDQLEDALAAIDDAIRMNNGRNGRAFYEKGIILRRMDRFDEALDCFNRAIRLEKGKFANTYLERAITLRRLSRWQDALKDVDAAIRLNSHRPQAYCERARVLRRMGRLPEAMDSIRTAIALDPTSSFYHDEWSRIDAMSNADKK